MKTESKLFMKKKSLIFTVFSCALFMQSISLPKCVLASQGMDTGGEPSPDFKEGHFWGFRIPDLGTFDTHSENLTLNFAGIIGQKVGFVELAVEPKIYFNRNPVRVTETNTYGYVSENTFNASLIGVDIKPRAEFNLRPREMTSPFVALFGLLNYSHFRLKTDHETVVKVGIGLGVGLKFFLNAGAVLTLGYEISRRPLGASKKFSDLGNSESHWFSEIPIGFRFYF